MIEEIKKKRIKITIDNGSEDLQLLKEYGRVALRQARIERITDEAIEQNGVMSQEDISRCLKCDTRTIQGLGKEWGSLIILMQCIRLAHYSYWIPPARSGTGMTKKERE